MVKGINKNVKRMGFNQNKGEKEDKEAREKKYGGKNKKRINVRGERKILEKVKKKNGGEKKKDK
ncbi:hypothetical protein [Clostridioides difficile]|uniref:hypothetical protein n=1 Tax=Clostridioides difficile TaxID=1496 RepID=UPI00117A9C09|nr:hypothetical protein [Clostridioides difficile]